MLRFLDAEGSLRIKDLFPHFFPPSLSWLSKGVTNDFPGRVWILIIILNIEYWYSGKKMGKTITVKKKRKKTRSRPRKKVRFGKKWYRKRKKERKHANDRNYYLWLKVKLIDIFKFKTFFFFLIAFLVESVFFSYFFVFSYDFPPKGCSNSKMFDDRTFKIEDRLFEIKEQTLKLKRFHFFLEKVSAFFQSGKTLETDRKKGNFFRKKRNLLSFKVSYSKLRNVIPPISEWRISGRFLPSRNLV